MQIGLVNISFLDFHSHKPVTVHQQYTAAFSKCFWGAGYIKVEAVWLLKATFRAPVEREHLGGSGKFLKLRCSMVWFGAIWGTWRVRIVSHFYQLDLLSFAITCPKIPFIHKLFQVCQDKIAKHLHFVFLLN